jgi:hypothetical protein
MIATALLGFTPRPSPASRSPCVRGSGQPLPAAPRNALSLMSLRQSRRQGRARHRHAGILQGPAAVALAANLPTPGAAARSSHPSGRETPARRLGGVPHVQTDDHPTCQKRASVAAEQSSVRRRSSSGNVAVWLGVAKPGKFPIGERDETNCHSRRRGLGAGRRQLRRSAALGATRGSAFRRCPRS